MTWLDIDTDLESYRKINDKDYFDIVQHMFGQKYVKHIILADNRSSLEKNRPQSMYIGILYNLKGIITED